MYVLAESPTAKSSLQDFDLSRNTSLRTLRLTAGSIDRALEDDPPGTASIFLDRVLSTITSPAFSDVMVVYEDDDFRGIISQFEEYSDWPHLRETSETERAKEASLHRRRFRVLRGLRKAREFQLVLCAEVWDPVGDYSIQMLKEAVADEKAKNGFEYFRSEPPVIYHPRMTRPWYYLI